MLLSLINELLLPFMRENNLDGAVYQQLLSFSLLPWGAKCLLGVLSDRVLLCGRRRRGYMLLVNILGILSAATLLLLPPDAAAHYSLLCVAVPILGLHAQIASLEMLSEGLYLPLLQQNPQSASSLLALVGFSSTAGSLLGRVIAGPVSDSWGSGPLFCLCLPLSLQSFFPVLFNFGGEPKLTQTHCSSSSSNSSSSSSSSNSSSRRMCSSSSNTPCCMRIHPQKGDKGVVGVAVLSAVCAAAAATAAIVEEGRIAIVLSACICGLLTVGCMCLLPRPLACCAVYFFFDRLLHLSIQGALNFYYTAPPACVAGGPHFSYTYFSAYTAVASTVASWIGIFAFHKWFKAWSCRSAFRV